MDDALGFSRGNDGVEIGNYEQAPAGENPENPLVPQILILIKCAPMQATNTPRHPMKSLLYRHSHLIALALFAIVGAAVLDDYGIGTDEKAQREIGYAAFNYILGDEDALIKGHFDRLYGVAVEVPLVAAERLFGLEDSRAIYLSRHLITHILFLVSGFFAWLLAYRMFGNRLVALLTMSLFLLHPRIYAHSFFNSKDPVFLSAFMVALYLAHRAFRRDTVRAFALCGAGVALLMNIRIMGVILLPAILGMLALDAVFAVSRGGGGGKIRSRQSRRLQRRFRRRPLRRLSAFVGKPA